MHAVLWGPVFPTTCINIHGMHKCNVTCITIGVYSGGVCWWKSTQCKGKQYLCPSMYTKLRLIFIKLYRHNFQYFSSITRDVYMLSNTNTAHTACDTEWAGRPYDKQHCLLGKLTSWPGTNMPHNDRGLVELENGLCIQIPRDSYAFLCDINGVLTFALPDDVRHMGRLLLIRLSQRHICLFTMIFVQLCICFIFWERYASDQIARSKT